jgi:hypothetical protein
MQSNGRSELITVQYSLVTVTELAASYRVMIGLWRFDHIVVDRCPRLPDRDARDTNLQADVRRAGAIVHLTSNELSTITEETTVPLLVHNTRNLIRQLLASLFSKGLRES